MHSLLNACACAVYACAVYACACALCSLPAWASAVYRKLFLCVNCTLAHAQFILHLHMRSLLIFYICAYAVHLLAHTQFTRLRMRSLSYAFHAQFTVRLRMRSDSTILSAFLGRRVVCGLAGVACFMRSVIRMRSLPACACAVTI